MELASLESSLALSFKEEVQQVRDKLQYLMAPFSQNQRPHYDKASLLLFGL